MNKGVGNREERGGGTEGSHVDGRSLASRRLVGIKGEGKNLHQVFPLVLFSFVPVEMSKA